MSSVTVKCIGCGATAKIGPITTKGQDPPVLEGAAVVAGIGDDGGPPVCRTCGMPMLPQQAESTPAPRNRAKRRR